MTSIIFACLQQGPNMYERFSDRARKVMQLANRVAQEFNHEYIGTEHILLGLCREGDGIGCQVLKLLTRVDDVVANVRCLLTYGPDMVTMGKLPQTPRAKKVINYAVQESASLQHNHVGTEHILLGLLREQEGIAHQVLAGMGVTLEKAREAINAILATATPAPIITGPGFYRQRDGKQAEVAGMSSRHNQWIGSDGNVVMSRWHADGRHYNYDKRIDIVGPWTEPVTREVEVYLYRAVGEGNEFVGVGTSFAPFPNNKANTVIGSARVTLIEGQFAE